ncbi:aldehyde dehydrogenase (NADP(+)) [Amycolatopsis acidicola]|uniref:aldehyde dehydrogenase (NADP(+)) n=1 Tax=Amycolatopsis acidicola TaxID=2596893 RepID=UPI001FB74A56|nr:aldehyde dehydrogenase (NADP(+)) [Amycolatopsis acidicola]
MTTTETAELEQIVGAATAVAPLLEDLGRAGRAELLRAMADALEADRDGIVTTAAEETALTTPRLNGELTRTCYQLRLFAETLDEGSYLEATLDSRGDTPVGPRPDLRRMLVPIGAVAVFGASNFPLAFSVPGGDTASALAAGCPVVLKAHESHLETSRRCLDALRSVAPAGVIDAVYGREAAGALVSHPAIKAVGFTGSVAGGRALLELIHRRPDPIPFYGELASINPIVVTPDAAAERAEAIGAGFAASVTGSAGQLCTKPGLLFAPTGPDGDKLAAAAATALAEVPATRLLNRRIHDSYRSGTTALREAAHVLAEVDGDTGPLLLQVPAAQLDERVTEECFGPVAVIVRYPGESELDSALSSLPASLTATIHADAAADQERLTKLLRPKAGRLLYGGFPTGVAVSHAQHHGGPWPATNTLHTSVGTTAIRRFLRPVTWQDAPQAVLPKELRDGPAEIPRRIDGALVLPGVLSGRQR